MLDDSTKRQDAKPDQYTLAWWEERFAQILKGYRGATHGINRAVAEYEDCCKAIQELRLRCDALGADKARIGKLQAEFAALKDRVDRMAEFLNDWKAKKTS